jgi:ribonuclease J
VKLAEEMGYSEENIVVMENGNRLVIESDGAFFAENVTCGRVLVDTSGYAGVTDETLRDRGNLASDGVLFVHVAVDPDAGKIVGKPDVIARGMVSPNGEFDSLRDVVATMLDKLTHAELRDTSALHHEISDVARKFIKKSMNKRPLVIASVIEV